MTARQLQAVGGNDRPATIEQLRAEAQRIKIEAIKEVLERVGEIAAKEEAAKLVHLADLHHRLGHAQGRSEASWRFGLLGLALGVALTALAITAGAELMREERVMDRLITDTLEMQEQVR